MDDWKARHKKICGKEITSVQEAVDASRPKTLLKAPEISLFGPPQKGFKRTPQLVMHIRRLELEPTVDFVVPNQKGITINFDCPYKPVQTIFRAARYKAMTEGDREATAQMCHFLLWFFRAGWMDLQRGNNPDNVMDFEYMADELEKQFAFPESEEGDDGDAGSTVGGCSLSKTVSATSRDGGHRLAVS